MIKAVFWEDNSLKIIDQRQLPNEEIIITLNTLEEVEDAIKTLAIRGAPNLGVAALFGTCVGIANFDGDDFSLFTKYIDNVIDRISKTRPTAYDLFAALERVKAVAREVDGIKETKAAILRESFSLLSELEERSRKIAEHSREIIPNNARILTHCNTGTLAAPGDGTALAVIVEAHRLGKLKITYADETRPLLQGSRLTAWELHKRNIPVKVLSDNTSGILMQKKMVDFIVVGADRIAANYDAANKIGTYSLAVLAKYHNVPFYIAAPSNTFDYSIKSGKEIIIEKRSSDEVTSFKNCKSAPDGVKGVNYAFDVTPFELITGIITENGIIRPNKF